MSKEKLEECFKSYLEQANNLGERGFCQDTDDYQEFLKDAIDELFGYMYECGFSANKKQAECYKQLQRKTAELDKIEEVIAPYQEPLEADAFSLSGAIKSILQRKTAQCEEIKDYIKKDLAPFSQNLQKQLDTYKQAIEEIEEIVNVTHFQTLPLHRGSTHYLADKYDEARDKILYIISKAKGENNE